jgi:NDP-sugar pyrophosphorylase family protein
LTLPVAILAGGLGTRLGELTSDTPKALIPIHGRPFIEIQLELLASQGVKEVVICVGHFAEKIEAMLSNLRLPDITVNFSYDGPEMRGTGGAICNALPLLGDLFGVLYGDSYLELDFLGMSEYFQKQGAPSMMTFTLNNSEEHVSNVLKKTHNFIYYDKKKFHPGMKYIDFGMTFFRASAFASYPSDSRFDLASTLNSLSKSSELIGFQVTNNFFEIGSLAGIDRLEKYLAKNS